MQKTLGNALGTRYEEIRLMSLETVLCSSCGNSVPKGVRFCPQCGRVMEAAAASAPSIGDSGNDLAVPEGMARLRSDVDADAESGNPDDLQGTGNDEWLNSL